MARSPGNSLCSFSNLLSVLVVLSTTCYHFHLFIKTSTLVLEYTNNIDANQLSENRKLFLIIQRIIFTASAQYLMESNGLNIYLFALHTFIYNAVSVLVSFYLFEILCEAPFLTALETLNTFIIYAHNSCLYFNQERFH